VVSQKMFRRRLTLHSTLTGFFIKKIASASTSKIEVHVERLGAREYTCCTAGAAISCVNFDAYGTFDITMPYSI
jgi:hypothetical protein